MLGHIVRQWLDYTGVVLTIPVLIILTHAYSAFFYEEKTVWVIGTTILIAVFTVALIVFVVDIVIDIIKHRSKLC